MRWLAAARVVPLVVYPFVVYFALEYVETKYLALLLLAAFLVRNRAQVGALTRGLERAGALMLTAVALYAAGVWWSNDETVLRLYPAFLSTLTLALFGYTLYRRPTMIERFARLQHGDLPPEAVDYTARVTQVWCVFLLLNGAVAAYSALFMTRAAWALYNGFISYVLMGLLFAGEWALRRYRFGKVAV
jgi:uncharacterized membrane protein